MAAQNLTLSAATLELIESSALALNAADKAEELSEQKRKKSVSDLYTAWGSNPDYATACAMRDAWKADYKEDRGCLDTAVDQAWSRMFGLLKKEYGVEFPKAATKAAQAKAKSRGAGKAEIEKAVADAAGDPVTLAKAAAKAAEHGDIAKAALLTSAAAKANKDHASEAKKAASEALKAKREELRALVKDMDAAMLDKLLAVARGEMKAVKITKKESDQ